MSTLLTILLILAMLATVAALVRGIVIFLRSSSQHARGQAAYVAGVKQNQMMVARVTFQAIAIMLIVLILVLRR